MIIYLFILFYAMQDKNKKQAIFFLNNQVIKTKQSSKYSLAHTPPNLNHALSSMYDEWYVEQQELDLKIYKPIYYLLKAKVKNNKLCIKKFVSNVCTIAPQTYFS